MEVTIGTKFNKVVNKKNIECIVFDIFDVKTTSRSTGKTIDRVLYYVKSDNYGMGQSFEIAKSTIIRGLIK